jgi:thiamine-monophosphate kinase
MMLAAMERNMQTLKSIGELKAIERICRRLPPGRDVRVGAGDDCAVVKAGDGEEWRLTSDPVIEQVHFASGTAPYDVGYKAVGRVLSDIAAMGGAPRWGLIDVVAPPDTPVSVLDELYRGVIESSAKHRFAIVGGDMAEGPCLELHVFGIGAAPAGRALLRSGAKPGDVLFVTGSLGGSLLGRHLRIEPRIEQGIWLLDWASAMIDVSDGLATDLRHLTDRSGVGCDLDGAQVPVSDAAKPMADGISALEHALRDGEDFELLFTVPEGKAERFVDAWRGRFELRCTRVGVMTRDVGILRCRMPGGEMRALDAAGFEHFGGKTRT